jgi:TonB-dependent SusC/RagA subfamily outer membrane receptor
VTGGGSNFTVSIRGSNSAPLFVLDGIPIDQDFVTGLPIQDVETIEVLKGASAAIYGSRGGGGVIAIYTKRGNPNYEYSEKDYVSGVLSLTLPGFDRPREFYSPNYGQPQEEQRLDYRNLLYWNPEILTDENGIATVAFYTSDVPSSFKVIVEGISYFGNVGRGEYTFMTE